MSAKDALLAHITTTHLPLLMNFSMKLNLTLTGVIVSSFGDFLNCVETSSSVFELMWEYARIRECVQTTQHTYNVAFGAGSHVLASLEKRFDKNIKRKAGLQRIRSHRSLAEMRAITVLNFTILRNSQRSRLPTPLHITIIRAWVRLGQSVKFLELHRGRGMRVVDRIWGQLRSSVQFCVYAPVVLFDTLTGLQRQSLPSNFQFGALPLIMLALKSQDCECRVLYFASLVPHRLLPKRSVA
mmetsp:Transcript_27922/g.95180  ORF Transcript_27922/g.95180 Transcript_27922/m.95180 type:complete len:241 (+) Transcript_27922:1959-2681(+)